MYARHVSFYCGPLALVFLLAASRSLYFGKTTDDFFDFLFSTRFLPLDALDDGPLQSTSMTARTSVLAVRAQQNLRGKR